MFQSAKITDPYGLHAPVPFAFIFPEKDEIAGREVIHAGSGVYVFKENIILDPEDTCVVRKLAECYPDLNFITYEKRQCHASTTEFEEKLRVEEKKEGMEAEKPMYGIAFVVSKKRGLYNGDILSEMLYRGRLDKYFNIPDENRWFIRASEKYIEGENNSQCYHIYMKEEYWNEEEYRAGEASGKKPSGKLQFEFTPEKYELEEGKYCKYMLLQEKVGYHIGKGIYTFRGWHDIPYLEDEYKKNGCIPRDPIYDGESYYPWSERKIESKNYYFAGQSMWF